MKVIEADYLIVGAGIVGLSVAKSLLAAFNNPSIVIVEKEEAEAQHASGRNSGVLHAGFYYSSDSLKAKSTVEGNARLKQYCKENNLLLNCCGKLLVAKNEEEIKTLIELEKRGKTNGVEVSLIELHEAEKLEPNIRTFKKALYSPNTASIEPTEVCACLRRELAGKGVEFIFNVKFELTSSGEYQAGDSIIRCKKLISCAGLYADEIAHKFGFAKDFVVLPFKGLYLYYDGEDKPVRMNVYPVPHKLNPFVGVHFTIGGDGRIEIGPTATPCFWHEQYDWWRRFSWRELITNFFWQGRLFLGNNFGFRDLAINEIKKYNKKVMISDAAGLVKKLDPTAFRSYSRPGIRAQLLNKKTKELVNDFMVLGDSKRIFVLNAVSPTFTCAFPFADYVVDKFV